MYDILRAMAVMIAIDNEEYVPIIKAQKTIEELSICIETLNKNEIGAIKKVVEKYNLNPNLLVKYKDIELQDFLYVLD
jgi:hypothetical protein